MVQYERKRGRGPNRVREAAPAYTLEPAASAYAITMAERGRMVLPVDVREQLNIKAGDRLTLLIEADGSLRLLTPDAYIARLRGAYKHLAPGRSLVDDLIAERRREAAIEDRKDRQAYRRTKVRR